MAELAKGSATTDEAALALLDTRPELQHLSYSLDANNILLGEVR